jgi:hypothetical protein
MSEARPSPRRERRRRRRRRRRSVLLMGKRRRSWGIKTLVKSSNFEAKLPSPSQIPLLGC